MSTSESEPAAYAKAKYEDVKVGTFDLTIVKATGLKWNTIFPSQFYVSVEIGDRICKTSVSKRLVQSQLQVWNEKFTFASKGFPYVNINVFRKSLIGKNVKVESISKRLADFEPRNTDVHIEILKGTKHPATITLRVGETIFSGPKCRVYALVIGIEKYACPDMHFLYGSMHDAKSFKTFLTDCLHVPDSQIKFLMNETATRRGILDAFRNHLMDNPDIDEGDAIVFFYAGHGSRVMAPEGWPAVDGKIETICPHDERMKDKNGEIVYGIPDRTINMMFRELAAKKGNNITAIFDSCHSGGITRATPNHTPLTVRFVETPPTIEIPPSLDSDILGSTHTRAVDVSIPTGFQHKHMETHVLLAACGQDQYAHEARTNDGLPCGFFTDNLVKQLRSIELNRATYVDLLSMLPEMIFQTPQCEGDNKRRVLFDGKAVVGDPKAFKLVEKEGKIRVYAGSVHGVVVGTEFAVQALDATPSSRKDLGILVALVVDIDSSILGHRPASDKFDIPKGAKAVVSDWNNVALTLKVAVELKAEDPLAEVLFPERDLTQPDQVKQILNSRFVKVHTRADADIVVKRNSVDEDLVIQRVDPFISKYATVTTKFNPGCRVHHFQDIFDAIAQFNYYLMWRPQAGDNPFEQLVSMELYKLITPLNSINRVPDREVGNLFVGNDARVKVDSEARYGLSITNRSQHDLFPYLFYFDPSDYSIHSYFAPPSSTGTAPLRAQQGSDPSPVTIGYGAGGGDPLVFTLHPDESSDTGFFKLFVFPKYVDMDWLKQGSAFDMLDKRGVGLAPDKIENWGAWIAAVTVSAELPDSDIGGGELGQPEGGPTPLSPD